MLVILKWVAPKILAKFQNRIVASERSTLRIEESAAFNGGNLYIVQARSKTLLIASSSTGVTFLSDLTEDIPASPAVPTFMEIVEAAEENA